MRCGRSGAVPAAWRHTVTDLLFVLATLVFFGLSLAAVAGCDQIVRS